MTIPHEKRFHFHDGTSIGSLKDLKKKLEQLPYDEFYEHVNEEKNDFANWVEFVLQEKELAEKLKAVSSIVESVELINESLHPPVPTTDEDYADLQAKIEEKLFADLKPKDDWSEPAEEIRELPDSETIEQPEPVETPAAPAEVSTPEPMSELPDGDNADNEQPESNEQISFPTKEELEGDKTPGEPVTTTDEPHKPVTELVKEQPPHPDHMKFVVKQFMYGLGLGLIAGFILGRLIGL